MNSFQPCRNTSDIVPLYLPQQLYLKPEARLSISLQIPHVKKQEKSISHWEIMEKLRTLIRPDEFSVLKVTKTTLEFVRFEAEIENRTRLEKVISKLDNNSVKLKDFKDIIRVKAGESKMDFPSRQKWDSFFQDAKDMDEMKPGQRPDTLYLAFLPRKWFVPYRLAEDEDATPSETMFHRIFKKFGPIRFVDIPSCDPYRNKMKETISGFKTHEYDDKDFFEGYVQFKDYIGFSKCMDELRGMKLLKKSDDEALSARIKVDFDRSKHLSDASISRREIVRDRLVEKQKGKEEKEKNQLDEKKKKEQTERQQELSKKDEKEKRRKEREAKRKAKILDKLKINGCDEIIDKIAKEEKKLLKAQRKLEAIRLVEELFRRIKDKKEEFNVKTMAMTASGDELRRFKNLSELKVLTQRQNLHNAIEGRAVLKSILSGKQKRSQSSSSDSSEQNNKDNISGAPMVGYDPNWYAYAYYPPPMGAPIPMFPPRGGRGHMAGPSRGCMPYRGRPFRGRFRGNYRNRYAPEMEAEYTRYFSKFYSQHDDGSRSRSRRRSYSRSRTPSPRRGRRARRSSSNYTPSPKKRSPSRSRSRSRSRSVDTSKFVSPRTMRSRRSRTRSRSWSAPRRDRSRSWSKSAEAKK